MSKKKRIKLLEQNLEVLMNELNALEKKVKALFPVSITYRPK